MATTGKHQIPSNKQNTTYFVGYSQDTKDIQPDNPNSFDDSIAYDAIAMPVHKDLLKIESVFIEDSPYPQPEIESITIDDVKKEHFTDDDDDDDNFWTNDNYGESSNEPFQIVKCESLAAEVESKSNIKKGTESSNRVKKRNEIKAENSDKSNSEEDEI